MLALFEDRARYWIPRLHFGIILLLFGELVAWQNATTYRPLDWPVLLLIYTALAAMLLDFIVRFHVNNLTGLLLVAGIFGLAQGTLISLETAVDVENFSTGLVFRPLGIEVIMFLLAFSSYRLLISGEPTGFWNFLVAGVTGLGWGVWARWHAEFEGISGATLTFDESAPYLFTGLLLAGFFPLLERIFPLHSMDVSDWLLTPYEAATAGAVLVITLLMRTQYMQTFGLGAALTLIIMLLFMLFYSRGIRRTDFLQTVTPPRQPLYIGWVILIIPFVVLGWAGFQLFGGTELPGQVDTFFSAISLFGLAWVPAVSVLLGISIFTRLIGEDYG